MSSATREVQKTLVKLGPFLLFMWVMCGYIWLRGGFGRRRNFTRFSPDEMLLMFQVAAVLTVLLPILCIPIGLWRYRARGFRVSGRILGKEESEAEGKSVVDVTFEYSFRGASRTITHRVPLTRWAVFRADHPSDEEVAVLLNRNDPSVARIEEL